MSLSDDLEKNEQQRGAAGKVSPAVVFWFTGLSGSGKTTIATSFSEAIQKMGKRIRIFDGDDVRNSLHKQLGFTPEDIIENNSLIAHLCVKHREDADYILVPIISPFVRSRDEARKIIGESFVEVYIKASLQEVMRRDVKGLYKKALKGEIENFIGLAKNVPYETPPDPEIILDTERESLEACTARLVAYAEKCWKKKN